MIRYSVVYPTIGTGNNPARMQGPIILIVNQRTLSLKDARVELGGQELVARWRKGALSLT